MGVEVCNTGVDDAGLLFAVERERPREVPAEEGYDADDDTATVVSEIARWYSEGRDLVEMKGELYLAGAASEDE